VTGMDTLTAAFAYAKAGWYLVPVRHGANNPGSVVGDGWQHMSSREPQVITAWLAGTDHGIALHAGRSGAVIFDIDNIPGLADCPVLTDALNAHIRGGYPVQRTGPGRGHYVFTQPPGRSLGNSKGRLAGPWDEIRGKNGVIVAAATPHPEGRKYEWVVATGPVPELPAVLAALLPDATDAQDAATDAEVAAFLAAHTARWQPHRLELTVADLEKRINAGEARHDTALVKTALALKEAARGMFSATDAADRIGEVFTAAACRDMTATRPRTRTRTRAEAVSEYAGIVAWAVGQAAAVSPQTRQFRQPWDAGEAGETVARQDGTGPQIITLANVTPERVSWLWDGRLPLGKLVILDGDPGVGKSSLTTDWAACVSTGKPWPDGASCAQGGVLILSAEDGLADTIRPRLDAAGADPSAVHALTAIIAENSDCDRFSRPPVIPTDLGYIEEVITARNIKLVIVDVLMAYLSGQVNSHRDQDVRRALHLLAGLAARTGTCIVLLRHLNKSGGNNALYRGGGSIGILGQARAAFIAAPDPDDDSATRRILAASKMNIAAMPPIARLPAHRRQRPRLRPHRMARGNGSQGRRSPRRPINPDDQEDRTARDEAVEWLRGYLMPLGGEATPADAKKAAREAGIAIRTLERARLRAGVTLRRSGFPARTVWALDE
jgi:hypothetical protein